MSILEEIKGISSTAVYSEKEKCIVLADNATKVKELLDNKGYVCDNNMFGNYPEKADGLIVYYDPSDPACNGYLVIPKDVALNCIAKV